MILERFVADDRRAAKETASFDRCPKLDEMIGRDIGFLPTLVSLADDAEWAAQITAAF
jgi:hypothetical protein